jgi:hypothetical protein
MKPFEETLAATSASWVGEGLITEQQREAILQRHPVPESGGSRFIGIVATVGGLLFAVGVSLIIKANWEGIGDWVKIAGVVALLVGAYAIGWKLKMVDRRYTKTGDVCLMVGQLFFLCGIALVSQIFHLNSRPASGVLIWWLGIALLPWLTRAKGAQFVSIVAALVWLGMEMTTAGSWIEIGHDGDGYGRKVVTMVAAFVPLGFALWLGGIALRGTRWSAFSGVHEKWGLLVGCGALYWLGFIRHAWEFRRHVAARPDASEWCALGLGLGLMALAALVAWRNRAADVKAIAPWMILALVPALGAVVFGPLGDEGWLWSALAWLTLFVLSIFVVRAGIETGREGWVNLGILFIATNVVTRYFDLFGTMLEGGAFFVVTGVLVAALGIYMERKRRALVAAARQEAVA